MSDNESNAKDEEMICPLCAEPLDRDDRNFYPCTCGYQVYLYKINSYVYGVIKKYVKKIIQDVHNVDKNIKKKI